jgi:hypothetical protein
MREDLPLFARKECEEIFRQLWEMQKKTTEKALINVHSVYWLML